MIGSDFIRNPFRNFKYYIHWTKTGLFEYHYPVCCVAFFMFYPETKGRYKYVRKNIDGYVPCPLCAMRYKL